MAGRQRIRVGGPLQGPVSAVNLPAAEPVPLQSTDYNEERPVVFNKPRQITPPSQPRVWAPSKQQQVGRMPAAAAMALEMEELESAGAHGSAVVALGPPSFTSPQTYSTNWYNKSFEPAATSNSSNSAYTAVAGADRSSSGTVIHQEQHQSSQRQSAAGPDTSSASSSSSNNTGAFQQPRYSITSGQRPSAVMQNNLMGSTGNNFTGGTGRGSAAEELTKYLRGSKEKNSVEAFSEPVAVPVPPAAALATGYGTGVHVVAVSNGNNSSSSVKRPLAAQARVASSLAGKTPAAWEATVKELLAAGAHLDALSQPGPTEGVVRCYVRRQKSFLGSHASFEVYLEVGHVFMMAARRRKKSRNNSYVVSLDAADTRKDSTNIIGKLKSDFMGTEYTLWQPGGNPAGKKGFGKQGLAVNFKPSIKSVKGGPRTMMIALPVPDDKAWMSSAPLEGPESLAGCLERARQRALPQNTERCLCMLHTMQPFYDPVKRVHYLDFKGRVTKSSLKNCQLVHWDHNTDQLGSDLVFLFGKRGHEEFAMDFSYPLNMIQALAIALSSIDTKLCNTI